MLRVFIKNELTKNYGNNSEAFGLSNYHIKTLMMWACELTSSSYWTDDLNLIRICVELLHTLSIWLTDARCQHYFVNNCNLLDNSCGVVLVANHLVSLDEVRLSAWFVNNYIQKCSVCCPDSVSALLSDVSTNAKLQNAVSAIVDWRLNRALVDRWRALRVLQFVVSYYVLEFSLTVRSCTCSITGSANTGIHLPLYFTSVAFLHVAYKISTIGFADELMDVLATLA